MDFAIIDRKESIQKLISNPINEYFFPSPNRPDARGKVIEIVRESTNYIRWNPMWETELKPSSYERLGEIQLPVLIIPADKDSEIILEIGEYYNVPRGLDTELKK
ncbi:hypothetical protein [Desulfosporosinus shakirovi]|uniref:hypothetical protein n=1 Tax=Desulfosporosinus shakirovi TaxID=2885154 RepID=UPI001E3E1870|nr:hypothetical protein [Desulfosporosinus sp. SRJS8]MCB8815431.1 hypothetical protein [Desulfosporosinus sp. SRJS8]